MDNETLVYELRTTKHFTLTENPLKRGDLDDFVACYNAKNRHNRNESERFNSFTYQEPTKRDKLNLDIFRLKDESLEDSANLPPPGRRSVSAAFEIYIFRPPSMPSRPPELLVSATAARTT